MSRPAWPMRWLGRRTYAPLLAHMQDRARRVAAGEAAEAVWFCEHEPVYTTGRRGVDNRRVDRLPAPLVQTDRGGETTFHGPGQLMCYPIVNLRRLRLGARAWVRMLEESCLALLAVHGIEAGRRCGFPGVWVAGAKIAALGVRIRQGVAYHGMALNVAVEPGWFSAITPCGLAAPVTDMRSAGRQAPSLESLAAEWHGCLYRTLERLPARGA
ncbi:MAG: lipoyl(octanoyl) transferase LipB [Mariprofundaceae bacterium]